MAHYGVVDTYGFNKPVLSGLILENPPWFGNTGVRAIDQYEHSIRGRAFQRDEDGDDVPLADVFVVLLWRQTMVVVARVLTDEDGYYAFSRLPAAQNAFMAIALDPEGLPVQNAVVFDRLTSSLA